jgi:hypothetical protein
VDNPVFDESASAAEGQAVAPPGLEGDRGDFALQLVQWHQAATLPGWLRAGYAAAAPWSCGWYSSQAVRRPLGSHRPRPEGNQGAGVQVAREVAGLNHVVEHLFVHGPDLLGSSRFHLWPAGLQYSQCGNTTVPLVGPHRLARSVTTTARLPGRCQYCVRTATACPVSIRLW